MEVYCFLSGRTASCRRGEPLSVDTETLLCETNSILFDEKSYIIQSIAARHGGHHTNAFLTGNVGFHSPAWRHYELAALIRLVNFPHPQLGKISPRITAPDCHRHSTHRTASVSGDPFSCLLLQETHSALGSLHTFANIYFSVASMKELLLTHIYKFKTTCNSADFGRFLGPIMTS